MFSRDKGWKALANDILTFCKVMQFEPSSSVLHYLLRVQNIGRGGMRLSPQLSNIEQFQVICVASLFRALVHNIPSYLFHEDPSRAEAWIEAMKMSCAAAIEPLKSQLQVSKQRKFLVANNVHVAHCIGPFDDDSKFRPGRQDIILFDFDDTPTFRINRICELTKNTILYVPRNEFLGKPANRREDSNG